MPCDCRSRHCRRARRAGHRRDMRAGVAGADVARVSALQLQRARVESVARRAGDLGRERDRLLERQRRQQRRAASRRARRRLLALGVRRRQRMQDEHEFAAHAGSASAASQAGSGRGRHRRDGLELLGQLAAHRHRALGQRLGERVGERFDPVRRFEHDLRGAARAPSRRCARARSAAACRQEADEREAARARASPAAAQRGERAARARDRHHAVAGGARRGDQLGARVAHRRRAGVADVGHALAAREPGEHRAARPRARCARARASSGLSIAEVAQQGGAVAGVLAGDRVDEREHVQRAQASGRRGCRSAWRRRTARPRDTAGRRRPRRRPATSFDPSTRATSGARLTVTSPPTTKALGDAAEARGPGSPERGRAGAGAAQLSGRARTARARRRGRPDHARRATARWSSSRCGRAATPRFGGAAASVGAGKQRRLVFAAQHFLRRLPTPPPCRFDVVAVDGDRDRVAARGVRRGLSAAHARGLNLAARDALSYHP